MVSQIAIVQPLLPMALVAASYAKIVCKENKSQTKQFCLCSEGEKVDESARNFILSASPRRVISLGSRN